MSEVYSAPYQILSQRTGKDETIR